MRTSRSHALRLTPARGGTIRSSTGRVRKPPRMPPRLHGMSVSDRAATGGLPAEPTSFVGRRRLLTDVKAAFGSTRLLTLVGPGGVGKTRLALRTAADLRRTMRDGASLIELAGLDDPQLVPKTVMTNLGLLDQSGQWPTSLLIAHLASREALLVVDNCEHLLDAIAVLADVVLKEAPGVRLLATSRQPLGISGERVLHVPPLTLPQETNSESAQGLAQSEAVSLLLERAADAGVELEITEANRQLVIDLCRRLDGMPLALELAAVRLRTIGLDQLLERLSDRFALLTGGSRAALPRQQTLKATIDWSHDLLTASERCLLRRLSVFPSDFELEAAEAVGTGNDVANASVLDLLAGLVEKSFLARLSVVTTARYRLHETMSEYARSRLREADEEDATIHAFVLYYAEMCQTALQAAATERIVDWLQRLDGEVDNVRAALKHCLDGPDHALGVSMVGSLGWYWSTRAVSEGVYWLDLFLKRDEGDSVALAQALFVRGFVAMVQGDTATAQRVLLDAEANARAIRDLPLVANTLAVSAIVRVMAEDLQGARTLAAEADALMHALDMPDVHWGLSHAQGLIAFAEGDLDGACRVYSESAHLSRQRGDLFALGYALQNHGFSLLLSGQSAEARPLFEEALGVASRLDNRVAALYGVLALGCHDALAGGHQRAARLLGAAESLQLETGVQLIWLMEPLLSKAREAVSASLGDSLFESELEAGRRMGREDAIAYALGKKRPTDHIGPTRKSGAMLLGKREQEVATLVADGLSNKEIASRLFLSERTVESHVSHILNRLGLNSRVQVASWVAREAKA